MSVLYRTISPHLDDGAVLFFLESQPDVGLGHVEDDGLALRPRGHPNLHVQFLVRLGPVNHRYIAAAVPRYTRCW